MAVDRLSALPDDLLRRILYFAPAKEGASTAVLSRRWRSLWRTSGAVNLDWRSFHRALGPGEVRVHDTTQSILRAVEAALASAAAGSRPVTKLTFHADMHHDASFLREMPYCAGGRRLWRTVVDVALAHPAAQHVVEELRVTAVDSSRLDGASKSYYTLSFGSLPSETLRDLHIVNCKGLSPAPPGTFFPRLTALRLQGCKFSLACLQGTIDAAPQLVTLHLESSKFPGDITVDSSPCNGRRLRLLCPAVTILVLADCRWSREDVEAILELDLPVVRYLRYKGHVSNLLSLTKPQVASSSLVRADLHFTEEYEHRAESKIFWQFMIQNLDMVKVLKLKLDFPIECIAFADKEDQDDQRSNMFFHNVEHLELEGRYGPDIKTAGVAIGDLLHYCPVVRDLHLKVIAVASIESWFHSSVERQTQLDFDKSVNHFRRRRRAPISLGKYHDDKTFDQVSDDPGLGKRSLYCLRSSLRRVSLQFLEDEPNSLGVQLAKFFAEKSQVLEELHVVDGNRKMCEHMNWNVRKWIKNSCKRKTPPTSTSFVDPCPRKCQRIGSES